MKAEVVKIAYLLYICLQTCRNLALWCVACYHNEYICGCEETMQQNITSQTAVGNVKATFSLQSTGRTVRSLSAGSVLIPTCCCGLLLFISLFSFIINSLN